MATAKKAAKKITTPGENMLKTVTEQLNTSLTSLKVQLGEKKFKKRIKKVAKKLVAGIKKTPLKKVVAKAKKAAPVKKKALKSALRN
jgi:hypothetical protein